MLFVLSLQGPRQMQKDGALLALDLLLGVPAFLLTGLALLLRHNFHLDPVHTRHEFGLVHGLAFLLATLYTGLR